MRVEYVEPDAGFAGILADSAFETLIYEVLADKAALLLAAEIIKTFLNLDALSGQGFPHETIERFASAYAAHPKRNKAPQRIAKAFRVLYAAHDPAHVRGAILEGLVERRLQTRYGGRDDQLVNNHKIRCNEEGKPTYTSSRSLDVIGWDHTVGECHDCKAAARHFVPSFVREMETELVPRRFKIGLVTADSRHATLLAFRRNNVQEPRHAQIIPLESLWKLAPLQS